MHDGARARARDFAVEPDAARPARRRISWCPPSPARSRSSRVASHSRRPSPRSSARSSSRLGWCPRLTRRRSSRRCRRLSWITSSSGVRLIEQAATERAVRDIDEALAPALLARQKHGEKHGPAGQPFFDPAYLQGRFPGALPESLPPAAGASRPRAAAHLRRFRQSAPRAAAAPGRAAGVRVAARTVRRAATSTAAGGVPGPAPPPPGTPGARAPPSPAASRRSPGMETASGLDAGQGGGLQPALERYRAAARASGSRRRHRPRRAIFAPARGTRGSRGCGWTSPPPPRLPAPRRLATVRRGAPRGGAEALPASVRRSSRRVDHRAKASPHGAHRRVGSTSRRFSRGDARGDGVAHLLGG